MRSFFTRRTFYTLFSVLVVVLGTLVAIRYAKGGFHFTDTGLQSETGLLAANSFPSGAQVFVDDRLVTATDDTLYLEPGSYKVRIGKDGYSSWQKQVALEKELVVQTNAKLFPVAPSLTNLTFTGLENLSPSPDGQKLLYYTASNSAQKKNGLYVLDLVDNPLSIQKGARQIAEDALAFDLAHANFIWSPDSSQVLVIAHNRQVLISIDKNNDLNALPDSTFQQRQILSEWEQEIYLRERQFLAQFPEEVVAMATVSAKNVYISPDKKRLLYTAIAQATIPDTIVPAVPATNSQPEERSIQPGGIYVYDREEDKNFRIGTENPLQPVAPSPSPSPAAGTKVVPKLPNIIAPPTLFQSKMLLNYDLATATTPATAAATQFRNLQASTPAQTALNFNVYYTSLYVNTFQWFPDSRHLLSVTDNQVQVREYDGTNATTLYSGPFDKTFLYPWPDGSRVIITTTFSPETPHNLYAIELK